MNRRHFLETIAASVAAAKLSPVAEKPVIETLTTKAPNYCLYYSPPQSSWILKTNESPGWDVDEEE